MTEQKTFYISTPIYYPSGKLHIGNAYSTLAADAMSRYKRLMGYDVFFVTGTDEHGQKIEQKAEELNLEPKAYVDGMAEKIQKLWQKLEITNNHFIRTTDKYHVQAVQKIFDQLLEQGDIYLGEYSGWYSVSDEEYFTETQLTEVFKDENGNVVGGIAPSGHEVELVKEESYFFKLDKYTDRLIEYYESDDQVILPEFRKNEMINNFIRPGLEDLAVSRTSFSWGIPVKSNPKHVVYVWIDALSNYITSLGYGSDNDEAFKKFWPADIHVLGKDISRFHMIYWPALLMALNLPLPKRIYAHGWIVMKDGKMSKSKGNVIYPETLIERYGLDATRYYLLRGMSLGSDSVFTPEDFVKDVNTELANDLGNLLNRTVAMINKYFQGAVPNKQVLQSQNDLDKEFANYLTEHLKEYHEKMELMAFDKAIDALMAIVSRSNKYIDQTEPWNLAKDSQLTDRLAVVMFHLAESLRIIGHLLRPFMTQAPLEIFKQLGIEKEIDANLSELAFGKFAENAQVIKKGVPIFPRLEVEEEVAYLQKAMTPESLSDTSSANLTVSDPDWNPEATKLSYAETAEVAFDDFIHTEIKVAEVIDVDEVEGSNKLLRFRLDAGDQGHRQILSGIRKYYPDFKELIGRKVLVVANLKPRKMMGHISQGMILSAESGKDLHLVFAPEQAENGSLIG
ncbi:methionine--tRNA ligase [Facklamia sp. 7083-14-GEN3]|uniref:methionine--tRNA ligase n=1 Tax=Facklamia sp. 7083-14-GEN3 TaxID=2973478 RepID=UPI00215C6D01|nr:methionine--tRNA ligase [Facklamia sp. 7083-14-GEN3]MCR8969662.1 methionine--tRNA ligase [Facklamia sp. 7083-14-GEN3]